MKKIALIALLAGFMLATAPTQAKAEPATAFAVAAGAAVALGLLTSGPDVVYVAPVAYAYPAYTYAAYPYYVYPYAYATYAYPYAYYSYPAVVVKK